MKYSPGADRVDLYLEREEDRAVLRIQDYGLGIPEEAKDKMFTKFYRVDNTDRRQIGGTGLGLAICKEIAEAHDGSLRFESEMGAGTTFFLDMPLYREEGVGGSLVILEDDVNLSHLMAEAVGRLGLPVVKFRAAEEALRALSAQGEPPPASGSSTSCWRAKKRLGLSRRPLPPSAPRRDAGHRVDRA
ncbi:ATP-binding protein [Paenibacillus sp. CC-CFT747]|nr:ATP-binding protein [Paenibacillus sp. CC-CFT747]